MSPKQVDPLVFLPDGSKVEHPITAVIIDDIEIPGHKIVATGFQVDANGMVTMRVQASQQVTLRYVDGDKPGEVQVMVDGR